MKMATPAKYTGDTGHGDEESPLLAALLKRLPAMTKDPQAMDRIIKVAAVYPFKISAHLLESIDTPEDPIGRQFIPDIRELAVDRLTPDPSHENGQTCAPHLVHRYPGRVLWLVSSECAAYCRFCMRKRMVGRATQNAARDLSDPEMGVIAYISTHPEIFEVILSGGDPFMLDDLHLAAILSALRRIPHVRIIRIHTRMPGVNPQRVTPELSHLLGRFHPLYINIQFNHPLEITPEVAAACGRLAGAGIPLGSQTVLLKGVNDDAAVISTLMMRLLEIRVRPYYLHHADPVRGTGHFRTSLATGIQIMRALQGRLPGMAIPRYMLDLPGGGGKVPVAPDYIRRMEADGLKVENYDGALCRYPLE